MYHSDASWRSRAKYLQVWVNSFQVNWVKFLSIWKMIVPVSTHYNCQLINLNSLHVPSVMLMSCPCVLYKSIGPQIFKHSHLYTCKSINLHLSIHKCIIFFSNFTYTSTVVLLINWLTRELWSQLYLPFGQFFTIEALD